MLQSLRFATLAVMAAHITVAAIMPKPMRLRSGDVKLRLAIDSDEPEWKLDETIDLEVISASGLAGLQFDDATEFVQVARISQSDFSRLKRVQKEARAYKKLNRNDNKGSLGVSIAGGCRDRAIGPGDLSARLFMRSDPGGSFFPVTRKIDPRSLIGEDGIEAVPLCGVDGNGARSGCAGVISGPMPVPTP